MNLSPISSFLCTQTKPNNLGPGQQIRFRRIKRKFARLSPLLIAPRQRRDREMMKERPWWSFWISREGFCTHSVATSCQYFRIWWLILKKIFLPRLNRIWIFLDLASMFVCLWHNTLTLVITLTIFIPPANEVFFFLGGGGVYRNHPVCLSVCPSVRLSVQSKLNLGYNFSTNRDKAFIFHMLVPCDKTFLSVSKHLTLWPWPWLLTYFWKNLTFAIIF